MQSTTETGLGDSMRPAPSTPVPECWKSRRFLTDTAKAVGNPRDILTQRLAAIQKVEPTDIDALFVAANYVALLLYRSGRIDDARNLCLKEIEVAAHRERRSAHLHLALDPQLNLARIDAKAGFPERALRTLELLNSILTERRVVFDSFQWRFEDAATNKTQALKRAIAALRNACTVEICSLLWSTGRVDELLNFSREVRMKWPEASRGVLFHTHEAQLLADPTTALGAPGQASRGHRYLEASWARSLPAQARVVLALHALSWSAAGRQDDQTLIRDAQAALSEVCGTRLACPSTLVMWQVDLAQSLSAIGDRGGARRALEFAIVTMRETADLSLAARIERLAARVFSDDDFLAIPTTATDLSNEEIGKAATEVFQRLESKSF